jgi:hypothetical protein
MHCFDGAPLLCDIIENAVGAEDNFAQRPARAAGIDRAYEREAGEDADMIEDAASDTICRLRIVPGDARANLIKVFKRRICPDYLELHALAQDSSKPAAFS